MKKDRDDHISCLKNTGGAVVQQQLNPALILLPLIICIFLCACGKEKAPHADSGKTQRKNNTTATGKRSAFKPIHIFTPSASQENAFTAQPAISHGNIFIAGTDGILYALSAIDGKIIWKSEIHAPAEAPVLVDGSTVFVGDEEGCMHAFALKTGQELWKFPTEGKINGRAVVAKSAEKNLLLFGSYDSNLYCLDAAEGKLVWRYKTESFINGSPAIVHGKAVVGGCDAKLRFISLETGKQVAVFDAGTYISSSPVISPDGRICTAALYSGELIAVNTDTGKELWHFQSGDDGKSGAFPASPAVTENSILIGSDNGTLFCLNAAAGKLLWAFKAAAAIKASPAAFNGTVICADENGMIYLLKSTTGSLIDQYDTADTITASPVFSAGRVYIASESGRIFVFSLPAQYE